PQRIVDKGDPYPQQVQRTAKAIAAELGLAPDDWEICYQSRVGPLKWLGPSTQERLTAAGQAKAPVVLVPIAFVSEHSETLVELDMEYRHVAETAGVPVYIRIAALGVQPEFIRSLSALVQNALSCTRLCGSGAVKCLTDR
ncbi:MAG: ferrochelatase, partial [Alphaproteobacteria bacterium]